MSESLNKPATPVPDCQVLAGVGLRFAHHEAVVLEKPDIGWLEVHPENYFSGGRVRHHLLQARELYPLSFHAVGLSLGSAEPVSQQHLQQIKELVDIYEPFFISDHASWSMSGNAHLNDLMPLPYTQEALQTLCRNISTVQDYLQREILIENPSSYLTYAIDDMPEYDFINETARKAGCKILLDVNNIYVQSHNHNFDPYHYIAQVDKSLVAEIHLAGHIEQTYEQTDQSLLIDTHSEPVKADVWSLYQFAAEHIGPVHTLIERDSDIPELSELVKEASLAADIMNNVRTKQYAAC